mgnify:CR=1 FL=1
MSPITEVNKTFACTKDFCFHGIPWLLMEVSQSSQFTCSVCYVKRECGMVSRKSIVVTPSGKLVRCFSTRQRKTLSGHLLPTPTHFHVSLTLYVFILRHSVPTSSPFHRIFMYQLRFVFLLRHSVLTSSPLHRIFTYYLRFVLI